MALWIDKYKEEQFFANQEEGHNKFYAVVVDPKTNIVYMRWGRFGTAGQSKTEQCSGYSVRSFVEKKIGEKRRKGYQPIDKATFDKLSIAGAVAGTQNKFTEIGWADVQIAGNRGTGKLVNADRLMDPACNPALAVRIELRKQKDDSRPTYDVLFTMDRAYVMSEGTGFNLRGLEPIGAGHPLADIVKKVEEAIGRTMS